MPKYKFELDNGKTLTLEGDTQPSDEEVESIAKEQGVKLKLADTAPKTESLQLKPEQFKPVDKPAPTPTPEAPPEEQGFLSKAWHAISDPLTDLPSRVAHNIGETIDQPSLERSPMSARLHGFTAGALQGAGDLVSGLSSPLNLTTAALTGGSSLAEKTGYTGVANLLGIAGRMTSAPVVAHGAADLLSPNSTMGERGQGLVEIAGGLAGMKERVPETTSFPKGWSPEELKSKASMSGSPEVKSTTVPHAVNEAGDIIDKYDQYRKVPVGTKYSIKPEDFNRKKMTDAIKLGFNVEGLDDNGRIMIRKIKESPKVQMPETIESKEHPLLEAANIPRTLLASEDLSAPLRQGLGLIHKKSFWTSLPDMVKAWGSEDAYNQIQKGITDDPIFKKTVDATGKIQPSFAEKAGLKLTNLNNMAQREESVMSSVAEKFPGVRPSNRAYTVFLNKLRADTFKQMTTDFSAFSGLDAKNNLPVAKSIADYINAASGRGSLGKLENSAATLSSVLFSPRLIASRLQLMGKGGTALFSPETYMLSQPSIRREYLKSLFAIAAAGNTVALLGKMGGAKVSMNPASADFGKPKIGNTRLDPYGGFQQMIVAAQRLMPEIDLSSQGLGKIGGQMQSTQTGRQYSLAHPAFGQSDRADVALRFLRGKTNPIINFGWGLMAGQKELSGKPMNMTTANPMENAIAQRFIPMLWQDIYDLYNSEATPLPAKVGAGVAATLGMGSQTYGRNDF